MSKYQEYLDEAIKGWKHAGSDIARARLQAGNESKPVKLVGLKKDGSENKMDSATTYYSDKKSAMDKVKYWQDINKKEMFFNLYEDGKLTGKVGGQGGGADDAKKKEDDSKAFKAAVSDINSLLTDASRKAAALGKDAQALEDAIDKARDIAFKLR